MSGLADYNSGTLTTTSNNVYEPNNVYSIPYYYSLCNTPQTACSGEVHVFPCPHCEKCKCGQATVKRPKAKK